MLHETNLQQSEKYEDTQLALALLNLAPKLVNRLHADVPIDDADETALRAVSELRATPGQLTLLRILVEHKCCTMQKLAEHLAVAPSTATAMVKRLLTQGYIERGRDDTDWRTVWVKPTEQGRQAVATYDHFRLESLQYRLAQLNEAERQSLVAALPAIRHLIDV